MSGVHYTTELMSGEKARNWVHQKPTNNQPTMDVMEGEDPSLIAQLKSDGIPFVAVLF